MLQFMKSHLTAKIVDFDPTAEEPADDPAPVELINSYLNGKRHQRTHCVTPVVALHNIQQHCYTEMADLFLV